MVFAGPGSPTYALRQWAGTPVPDLLADKLRTGGAVTFSSAAALTLGVALAQAVVGVISARTGVPPLLVSIHMLGAAVLSALLLFQWAAVRNWRKGDDGDRILVSSRSSAAG
jgi:heme A synthase